MYIRRSEDVLNVLCTFDLRPVSTGCLFNQGISQFGEYFRGITSLAFHLNFNFIAKEYQSVSQLR